MIVLDTNVLSALIRDVPEPLIAAWLDQQPRNAVWTTSITIYEIRFGLESMATGRRRTSLMQRFESFLQEIDHQVLAFDTASGEQATALSVSRKQRGRSVELRDTMIAGIVLARRATLATRNTKHFADLNIPVVNPWTD
jgi:toxin FitB